MEKMMGSGRFFWGVSGLLFLAVFVVMSVGGVGEVEACRYARGYRVFVGSNVLPDESGKVQESEMGPPKFPKEVEVELLKAENASVPKPGDYTSCSGAAFMSFKTPEYEEFGLEFEVLEGGAVRWIPSEPLQPLFSDKISFVRYVNIYKPQPEINMVLQVRWVDRWGRRSKQFKRIEIHIPAVEEFYDPESTPWTHPDPPVPSMSEKKEMEKRPENRVELREGL